VTSLYFCFFYAHAPPPAIYTLSLHDALPIFRHLRVRGPGRSRRGRARGARGTRGSRVRVVSTPLGAGPGLLVLVDPSRTGPAERSEEHTSELQSRGHLVCRLLLEKKKLTVLE